MIIEIQFFYSTSRIFTCLIISYSCNLKSIEAQSYHKNLSIEINESLASEFGTKFNGNKNQSTLVLLNDKSKFIFIPKVYLFC